MKKIKVCLHNHTFYSHFALNTVKDYTRAFNNNIIDKAAITDHNCIYSAFDFQEKIGSDRIIVGEEIDTLEGEIIGLFLTKQVPPNLSIKKACEQIKNQSGIIYVPHPISSKGLSLETMHEIKDFIDLVEVHNGWNYLLLPAVFPSRKIRRKILEFVRENHKTGISATDSHVSRDLGNCYIEMEDFNTKEEFMDNINREITLTKNDNKICYQTPVAFFKGLLDKYYLRLAEKTYNFTYSKKAPPI